MQTTCKTLSAYNLHQVQVYLQLYQYRNQGGSGDRRYRCYRCGGGSGGGGGGNGLR